MRYSESIKKLKKFVNKRNKLALRLTKGIKGLEGLQTPIVKKILQVLYNYSMILDYKKLNIKRKEIISMLEKEGVQGLVGGYSNIHLPLFFKTNIKIFHGVSIKMFIILIKRHMSSS